MKKLFLYFFSLIHLKPVQLFYLIKNRVFKSFSTKIEFHFQKFKFPEKKTAFLLKEDLIFFEKERVFLNFINKKRELTSWELDEEPLWIFNLHYFEYLLDKNISKKQGEKLILSWIDFFQTDFKKTAFHSYPTSLRIINWLKFIEKHQILNEKIIESIFIQMELLFKNLEFDLMANHLLTNLLSLNFSLNFFLGKDVEKMKKKIDFLLKKEIEKQFLKDGSHFERSLMYHSFLLELMLDNANISQDFFKKYRLKIEKSLNFLKAFSCNNQIALFNDSAFGISSNPSEIIEYSKKTGAFNFLQTELFQQGNFAKLLNKKITLFVDGGGKVNYQPGHAHSSALSFELFYKNQRVISDFGCGSYVAERLKIRGTQIHNTVSIDNKSQDEIWGNFRIARRAKNFPLIFEKNKIKGKVESYFGAKHLREFLLKNNELEIYDKVIFKGKHNFSLNFILSPFFDEKKVKIISSFPLKIENDEVFFHFNQKLKAQHFKIKGEFFDEVEILTKIKFEEEYL